VIRLLIVVLGWLIVSALRLLDAALAAVVGHGV
jgi:hypothetical protein